MERLKIIIGILLIQTACFSSVSSQDLLNNLLGDDDITWVTETEIFFSLEGNPKRNPIFKKESEYYQARIETVKISPEIYNDKSRTDFLLQGLINESVLEGYQKAFNDEGEELSKEEFQAYFTTVQKTKYVDFETKEMVESTVYSDDWSTRGFIVKMLWYYNQKELSIHSAILSFKPVTDKYIIDDKAIRITAKEDVNSLHYNDADVKWCKATKINNFDFSTSKLLKGNHVQFLEEIFKTNIEKEKYKTYSDKYRREIFYHEELELQEYKLSLLEEIDTFVSFDPVTYEETIEVAINSAIDFKELNMTSFIHYWYWDEKSKSLSVELEYFGLVSGYSERIRIKAKQD